MAVNLLRKIRDKMDDRLVGQIGAVLGENEERTRVGIEATLPTLLRGVMGVTSTDYGAQMVERELDSIDGGLVDDDVIDDYGKQLEFEKGLQLVEDGSALVQAIFGNATIRTMSIISRESGLSATKCRSLTGILMPLVLGVVGQARKDRNLDTPGFQRLLADQNDHVARRVPDGVCAALNLPRLEKRPFYPPQNAKPTLRPYRPSAGTASDGAAARSETSVAPNDLSTVAGSTDTKSALARDTDASSIGASQAVSLASKTDQGTSGMKWIWSLAPLALLLLALGGWLYSKQTADHEPPTDSTHQSPLLNLDQASRMAELNWDDDSSTPVVLDNQSPLQGEIPLIAPDFDDEDYDDEGLDDEGLDGEGFGDLRHGETTVDDSQEANDRRTGASNETAPPNSGPIEQEEQASRADQNASISSEPANRRENERNGADRRGGSDVSSTRAVGTLSADRTPSGRALQSVSKVTDLSNGQTESTIATALNRPRNGAATALIPSTSSDRPSSPDDQVGVVGDGGSGATDGVLASPRSRVDPSTELSGISAGLERALRQIDGVDAARRAAKRIERLCVDLEELAPQFARADAKGRHEFKRTAHALATELESLYDQHVDAPSEKAALLPTLITFMERLEATLVG